jgi:AbiU2
MRKQVDSLIDCTMATSGSYGIWLALTNPEMQEASKDAIRQLEILFNETAEAHFQRVCIGIGRMFEKREDTISLQSLVKMIDCDRPGSLDKFITETAPYMPLVKRIIMIRGSVYAHRSAKLEPEEAFKRAGLTPPNVGQVVSLGMDWTAQIAEWAGMGDRMSFIAQFEAHEHAANAETDRMLSMLVNAA